MTSENFPPRSRAASLERYVQFHDFAGRLIRETYKDARITAAAKFSGKEIDYVVERQGEPALIIEVKSSAPMTEGRIRDIGDRLIRTKEAWSAYSGKPAIAVLAVPVPLTPQRRDILARNDIECWDSAWIIEQSACRGLAENARRYVGDDQIGEFTKRAGEKFIEQLNGLAAGRADWSTHQSLCTDILQFLFCLPLKAPISELANLPKVNRRDIILPNYSTSGFFEFLHRRYGAEYIVADAKNYKKPVKKDAVLQVANYLSDHGAGLFGMVITRRGASASAEQAIRAQWIVHRKMIIILSDDDLVQMITSKESGKDPQVLIR